MRKVLASIIAILLFISLLPGLTLRMGIEGLSILGLSFQMDSGLCFGFGAYRRSRYSDRQPLTFFFHRGIQLLIDNATKG